MIEPLTDEQRGNLHRDFIEKHGSVLGEIAFQSVLDKRKQAIEEQIVDQAKMAELAAIIKTRHEELALALCPLEADRERIAAELTRADARVEEARRSAMAQIGELEGCRYAILRRLAGRIEPVELSEEQKAALTKAKSDPLPELLQEFLGQDSGSTDRLF